MVKLSILFVLSLLFIKSLCLTGFDFPKEAFYDLVDDYIAEKYGRGIEYRIASYTPNTRDNVHEFGIEQLVNGYFFQDAKTVFISNYDLSITDDLEFVLNANERYVVGEEPMTLEEFLQFYIDTKFSGQYKADLSKYTILKSKSTPHYYTISNIDFIDDAHLGSNQLKVYEFYERVPGFDNLYELYYYANIDYEDDKYFGYLSYGVFAYTHEVKVDEFYYENKYKN